MSKALFTFTIGPVKSFVNNGRKMRDLYAGSSILSDLTAYAMECVKGLKGFELVFPHLLDMDQTTVRSYPNRLVISVEEDCTNGEKRDIVADAKDIEKKVREKFKSLCLEILEGCSEQPKENVLALEKGGKAWSQPWATQQIESFLEVYWTFEPFEKDGKIREYGEVYQQLNKNLMSIKNLRPFKQTFESGGRKCGLHLEYNALFYKEKKAFLDEGSTYQLPDIAKFDYLVQDDETLSAIAFVKRFYEKTEHFLYSHRDMVFRKRLACDYPENPSWYEDYVDGCVDEKEVHRAGKITSIIDAIFDHYPQLVSSPQVTNTAAIKEAKSIIKQIKADIPNLKLKSYYAMLKFDGDSMGEVYRKFAKQDEHEDLSSKICKFAIEASELIKNVGGICIYAGGEDILAALPLEEIWSILEKLHCTFRKQVKIDGQPEITFSAGIVVAHLMEPLKDVMYQLDQAEGYAKKYPGKNAFAIKLMKRAGEYREIRYGFDHTKQYKALDDFRKMLADLEEEAYSKSFLTTMIGLVEQLPEDASWEMIKVLIKAGLGRQSFKSDELKGKVLERIEIFYHKSESVDNFLNTLDMVRFLASNAIIHQGGDS
ncbi:MAG: type III-B CRISPR-associated protein Cas10/Cmr2 [Defluviitaleaceae bacterium]|nr:type III-B CRISPR-associated protein Cas10/Cmr2 [Defluviitaleaceae bacterium]